MIVTYHGLGCIRASVGSTTFAFNPPSKNSDVIISKAGADAVLVSLNHPDYNGVEMTSYGDRELFVVNGPGEYEVQGYFIKGIASPGPDDSINTIYTMTIDDISICHLGGLATAGLSPEILGQIGGSDIVFVPTYGAGTLEAAEAHKLATKLGPKVIVPLFYAGPKNDHLSAFLKEEGSDIKPIEKWTVKRKDIDNLESEVVVIKSF